MAKINTVQDDTPLPATEKGKARAMKLQLLGEIAQMPRADRNACKAIAQKIRDAIAEGEAQEEGVGLMALGLVGSEIAEQQA